MKKVKVAVIDNGVNDKLLSHLLGYKLEVHCFQTYKNKCVSQFLTPDRGREHGTLCIALFIEFLERRLDVSHIELTSISILDRYGKQEIDGLITALKWCSNKNYDIILLSLGVKSTVYVDSLAPIIKQINMRKSIMIAATSNDGKMTYPACFNNVVGVKYSGDLGEKKFIISDGCAIDGIEISASFGESNVLKKYNRENEQEYVPSNSFIVPYIASFLCSYLQKTNKHMKNEIFQYLKEQENFVCVKVKSQRQTKNDGVPFVILTYNDAHKNSTDIFLRQIMRKFRLNGYACVCVTDVYLKSDFDKSIFSLSLYDVDECFDEYCWLLSDNSLILFYVITNSSILTKKNLICNVIHDADKIEIDKIVTMILDI